MKITAIELSEIDLKVIFNYLVSKFTEEDNKQTLSFDLCDIEAKHEFSKLELMDIERTNPYKFAILKSDQYFKDSFSNNINIEAELKLSTYYSDKDENSQTSIEDRYCDFKMTFFYNGEEIKENCDKVFEMINKYYEI